ncbi:MAG: DinB family protein [Chloroflexi bacterium]|nr:DinB family protein [Chloroflexota bacterium]
MDANERRAAVIQAFQASRVALLAAIAGLSEEELRNCTLDGWSALDHLAHVAQMEELRFFEISRVSAGHQVIHQGLTDEQAEALNQTGLELRRPMPLAQVLWELEFARARVLEAIQNATDRGLDASLYHHISLGGGADHEREHAAIIARMRAEAAGE